MYYNLKTLIAIPIYNNYEVALRTLDSCFIDNCNQKVLISDNNSPDFCQNTRNLFENNPNVIFYRQSSNLGRTGNWNFCLNFFYNSHFNYFRFIFPGDLLSKDSISHCLNIFKRNDDVGVIVGRSIFVTKENKFIIDSVPFKNVSCTFKTLIDSKLFPSNFLGSLNKVFFRKEMIQGLFFDKSFLGGHSFANNLNQKYTIFYTTNVLSYFYVKYHSSFNKQFTLEYNLEWSLNYIRGLSRIENLSPIDKDDRSIYIILDLVIKFLKQYKFKIIRYFLNRF
mgnify:CR=1 FL=1